jgi:hypothetical protein
MQIDLILLSFVFGFLISIIDYWEDEKKKMPPTLFTILASFVFLFLLFSKIFSVVAGVFLAVIFAKKFDAKSWRIFLIVAALFLPFFVFSSFQKINLSIFSILSTFYFFLFSFFDEIASDYADKQKGRKAKSLLVRFFKLRPFLEISSFVYSLIIFDFDFFACVFFFDVAYNLEKRLLLI